MSRTCALCQQPLSASARADALCCSRRCRQARHRGGSLAGRGPDRDRGLRRLAAALGVSVTGYEGPPAPAVRVVGERVVGRGLRARVVELPSTWSRLEHLGVIGSTSSTVPACPVGHAPVRARDGVPHENTITRIREPSGWHLLAGA